VKEILDKAGALMGAQTASLRGLAYMLGFSFLMSSMIAGVRHVSSDLPAIEVAFFRVFFGFIVFLPVLFRHGVGQLRTQRIGLHALRAVLHAASIMLFFLGVSVTPIAKAMSISFSAPLFATAIALIALGEVIRARRITALLFGFLGTLIVLRPGLVEIETGTIYMLWSAAAWGTAMIVIKVLSRTETSLTTTIYSTILMTPITFAVAVFFWQWPTWEQLAWLALIGGLGSLGHLCLAQAMKEADVSAIMPAEFSKLIWAALFGFIFFAEVPDWGTWVGGTVIFLSVTYIAYRERRIRSSVPKEDAG
jgi:drug/metabolite transporter (DMT)-like permease